MGLSDCRVDACRCLGPRPRQALLRERPRLSPGEEEQGVGVRYPCAEGTALFVYLAPDNAG